MGMETAERGRREERIEEAEENGGDFGMEDAGRKRRRSKDRSRKDVREEKEQGSRREREEDPDRKERAKEDSERKERRKVEGREERDREMEKGRRRDREGEQERSKERGKDRGRDHEKERDRERGKMREKDHDKDKERERGREKDHERGKYRDREKEKTKDKQREKERIDKNKQREKGKEKDAGKRSETDGRNSVERDKAIEDEHKDHEQNHESRQSTTSEIEERIAKMKEERLKKSGDDSEILSWVSKSRKLEDKRVIEREKTTRLMKALDDQDIIDTESEDEREPTGPSRKHLAGAKILHGLEKVLEGGTVVLTLKDQDILANGDVNEDVDMLESVEIGEQMRRSAAYKAAKKGAGVYDDKFSEEALLEKTILPKYDEPAQEEGVTLDESGRFSGDAEKKLEELRRRIQGNTIGKAYEDLNSYGKSSSDYFTPEEMLQFRKPKKKKSIRKKGKLDLEALEAEAKSTGLGAGDLGSRKDQTRLATKIERERTEAQLRTEAYESALAKAQEASLALSRAETITVVETLKDGEEEVFGDDYEELQKSLERARKLALSQKEEAVAGPQAVAREVRAKSVEAESRVSVDAQESRVVITEMEEFVLGLQLNEDTHKPDAEDVFMDEDREEDEKPHPRSDEAEAEADDVSARSKSKEVHAVEQSTSKDEDGDDVAEKVSPDDVIHEVVVGKGLSGALKLLQDRGALKETVEWGGRTMDKKKSKLVGVLDNKGNKEIRIERTDEFGRIMTPKEAFRMLSHKFHGKGPGKAKLEKRMKQYQEDLKLKQMKASDTPSMSVERMREAQSRLKTPYLVLSGHVKPGQTSDPMSGFATVEKDTLGSLTPMLGDRKVEHFLGIKRKEDFSGTGHPPSKKSKS